MMRIITPFLTFLVLSATACGSSDAPAASTSSSSPPVPLDPTFSNVVKTVITTTNCGGPLCHSLTAAGFQLGPKDTLYGELVNQPASGPECRQIGDSGTPYIRVVPGDPDNSLLYLKLRGRQPCGVSMPSSATVLTAAQIALVHDWIQAGANND